MIASSERTGNRGRWSSPLECSGLANSRRPQWPDGGCSPAAEVRVETRHVQEMGDVARRRRPVPGCSRHEKVLMDRIAGEERSDGPGKRCAWVASKRERWPGPILVSNTFTTSATPAAVNPQRSIMMPRRVRPSTSSPTMGRRPVPQIIRSSHLRSSRLRSSHPRSSSPPVSSTSYNPGRYDQYRPFGRAHFPRTSPRR